MHENCNAQIQTQNSPTETQDTAAMSTRLSSYDSWNGEMLGQDFSSSLSMNEVDSEGELDLEFHDIKNYLVKMCNELLDDWSPVPI